MDKRHATCLAALLAVCLTAGAGRAAADEGRESRKPDAWITAKVKSSLAVHKNVSAIGTDVDTNDGVVTLRGTVKTEAEKDLAGRYARGVEGVRRVDNQLVVEGSGDSSRQAESEGAGDRALDGAEGSGDRALNNAEGSGDRALNKAHDEASEAGDKAQGAGDRALGKIDDAALTSRVKSALAAEPGTSAVRTNVDSKNGRVRLRGTVASDAERDLAGNVARGVKGVRSVDNDLKVRESR